MTISTFRYEIAEAYRQKYAIVIKSLLSTKRDSYTWGAIGGHTFKMICELIFQMTAKLNFPFK